MWYLYLIIITLITGYCLLIPKLKEVKTVNSKTEQINKSLKNKQIQLAREVSNVQSELTALIAQRDEVSNSLELLKKQAESSADFFYKQAMETANTNIEHSMEELSRKYQQAEKDCQLAYQDMLTSAAADYSKTIEDKTAELAAINSQIASMQKTFEAAQEASRRAELIKSSPEDFVIVIPKADLADIKTLNALAVELNNPRVLYMLIWSTFIKTPLDKLCDKVFGKDEVCGIYKITNQLTNEVYIGQSNGCKERMHQHFKKGLGIDTPASNKFYNNMREYGVWNFSVELLEKCPKEQLNEKERFYINLYHSDKSLNSTIGNK